MKKARHYRGGYQLAALTELARELRGQRTPAENVLWQLLRNRQLQGFKFRRQHQFGGYVADFYCRKACLLMECDGSAHNSNGQWQTTRFAMRTCSARVSACCDSVTIRYSMTRRMFCTR